MSVFFPLKSTKILLVLGKLRILRSKSHFVLNLPENVSDKDLLESGQFLKWKKPFFVISCFNLNFGFLTFFKKFIQDL